MKLSAIEWCAIALTGLFLSFTIGYFVGSGNSGTIAVEGSVAVITTSSGSEAESEDTDEAGAADSMLTEDKTSFSETDESPEVTVTDESTSQGENAAEETESSDGQSDSESDSGLININTATEEELETLPGIGEELAARIVAYRSEYGPYQTVEDITNVNGIGDGRLSAIRDYITVGD